MIRWEVAVRAGLPTDPADPTAAVGKQWNNLLPGGNNEEGSSSWEHDDNGDNDEYP